MATILKYYYDLMSQPSRAMYIVLKLSGTPFEECKVALRNGEHLTDAYKKDVNRFQKVPCIVDNGFKLSESVAILRYLDSSGERISKALYPSDKKEKANVDEYLEWQHTTTRIGCAMYFRKKFLEPILLGVPEDPSQVEFAKVTMEKALDTIENLWLADKKFLASDKLTVADIFAACEIEQTVLTDYDPTEGRPKLKAWLQAVRDQCHPHYAEAHKYVKMLAEKTKSRL